MLSPRLTLVQGASENVRARSLARDAMRRKQIKEHIEVIVHTRIGNNLLTDSISFSVFAVLFVWVFQTLQNVMGQDELTQSETVEFAVNEIKRHEYLLASYVISLHVAFFLSLVLLSFRVSLLLLVEHPLPQLSLVLLLT